jgi:hypothetical protein
MAQKKTPAANKVVGEVRVASGAQGFEVWQVTAGAEDRKLGVYEKKADAESYAAAVRGDGS